MRNCMTIVCMSAVLALAGCGGSDPPEKQAQERKEIKPEENVFGTLVGAPKKVQDSTDAAAGQYRDSMNQRLEEDEGGSRKEEPSGD